MMIMKAANLTEETVHSLFPRGTKRRLGTAEGSSGPKRRASCIQTMCSQPLGVSAPHLSFTPELLPMIASGRIQPLDCVFVLGCFLLLPEFLSAIQFYKLLGWDLCLSSSFETVIHSVHPLHRILAAERLKSLFSKQIAEQAGSPGFPRSCSNGQM